MTIDTTMVQQNFLLEEEEDSDNDQDYDEGQFSGGNSSERLAREEDAIIRKNASALKKSKFRLSKVRMNLVQESTFEDRKVILVCRLPA